MSLLLSLDFGKKPRKVVLKNATVSKIGYYTPFGLVGLALSTIGSGLLTLLLPNSSTGDWVGFQLLSGMRGLALQVVSFLKSGCHQP